MCSYIKWILVPRLEHQRCSHISQPFHVERRHYWTRVEEIRVIADLA